MTAPQQPPQPPPQPDSPTAIMRMGDLRRLIRDENEAAHRERQAASQSDDRPPHQRRGVVQRRDEPQDRGRGGSVQEQVSEALERIQRDEARKKRDESVDKDIAELKQRTTERAPVERRRVHRMMGWGEPD